MKYIVKKTIDFLPRGDRPIINEIFQPYEYGFRLGLTIKLLLFGYIKRFY